MQLYLRCDFYNAVPSCSYLNESQKKKFNIKVNSHKSWKQQKQKQQAPSYSDVKRKALLVQNVLDARKKTAKQFQKMSSQSLSSNKVINATNSVKKQSQEHQIELMHMHTERLKYNKQTLETSENEATEKNNNKLQQSRKFSQSLSNIENNSDFESSVDCINTEDSVANYSN